MENSKGFEARANSFNEDFGKLQQKYAVKLYAANCVLKNGEVIPLIRLTDDLKLEFVGDPKKDEDVSKKGHSISEKK